MKKKNTVKDAVKPRIISIDKTDAKGAVCSDHQNCVIAKSIKRQTGAHWVDVGPRTVLIQPQPGRKIIRYKLQKKAQEQIRFFDKEGNFAPCFVELHAPPPSKTLGAIRQYSASYAERKKYAINRGIRVYRNRRSLATR